MSRIKAVNPNDATGKTKELFEIVQKKFGKVPNLLRTFGNSPAALEAYLKFSDALAGGVLNAKVREQIALAVAETNECEYCLSAHSVIGRMIGLEDDEIVRSRQVSSADPKIDELLKFSSRIVKKHGFVTNEDLRDVRAAGYGDEEITEAVVNVALNILTNYLNHVAQTEVDFPKVSALQKTA